MTAADVLDPVTLLGQMKTLQDALWRLAVLPPSAMADTDGAAGDVVATTFDASACVHVIASAGDIDNVVGIPTSFTDVAEGQMRKGHRARRSLPPRTYRTRADPFDRVNDELHDWYLESPAVPVKSLLRQLQHRHPGDYPDSLLRTLQRRVSAWRAETIIQFDDTGLLDDVLAAAAHPTALRAIALPLPLACRSLACASFAAPSKCESP